MSEWTDLKAAGNKAYTEQKFDEAIEYYGKAAADSSIPNADKATVLCNRAQCHLLKKDFAKVVDDTTSALELAPESGTEVKALFRR